MARTLTIYLVRNNRIESKYVSIVKGKVVDRSFVVNDTVIPAVFEFGRWYEAHLSNNVQCVELEQMAIQHVRNIHKSGL